MGGATGNWKTGEAGLPGSGWGQGKRVTRSLLKRRPTWTEVGPRRDRREDLGLGKGNLEMKRSALVYA